MPKKTRDMIAGLIKKGFRSEKGDHKYYLYYTLEGRKTAIFTKISHGKKEYDDALLGQMAKQLRINRSFLNGLFDCPKSQIDYEDYLREANIIK